MIYQDSTSIYHLHSFSPDTHTHTHKAHIATKTNKTNSLENEHGVYTAVYLIYAVPEAVRTGAKALLGLAAAVFVLALAAAAFERRSISAGRTLI